LLIIDDSFLLVIFSPNLLDFQIPVKVSMIISTPIINSIPDIGKKNARHIEISVNSSDCIDSINKDSCVFISLILQELQLS